MYLGAKYYDSQVNVWLSTDPLQEEYPKYLCVCILNPVRYTDSTGMWISENITNRM